MKDEISRILTMMENGVIDSEKAAELISLLKEKETANTDNVDRKTSKNYMDKTLKVRVQSEKEGNVKVNLPLRLVHVFLKAGHGIAANVPQAEKYVKDLDIDILIDAIENELDGEIVDVVSADENVKVFIE